MDRRSFLIARKQRSSVIDNSFPGVREIYSGLLPYNGPWTTTEITHLLKRTMFGAAKADVDYFKGRSVNETVNDLLVTPAVASLPPLKNYDNTNIPANDPEYSVAAGTTWVNTNTNDGTA